MKASPSLLSKIWHIWCYISGFVDILVFILVGYIWVSQSLKEAFFIRQELAPLCQLVEDFRDKNQRLPTQEEFETLTTIPQGVIYITSKLGNAPSWGVSGRDFIVGKWRGEHFTYYQSWDHKTWDDWSNWSPY